MSGPNLYPRVYPRGARATAALFVVMLLMFVAFVYIGHALVGVGNSWFGLSGVQLPSLLAFGTAPLFFSIALLLRLLRAGVGPAGPPWRRNLPVAMLFISVFAACGLWAGWIFTRDIIEAPLTMQVTAKGFECLTSSGMYSDVGWLPTPFFTQLPCGMSPGKYQVTITSASHMLLSWRAL